MRGHVERLIPTLGGFTARVIAPGGEILFVPARAVEKFRLARGDEIEFEASGPQPGRPLRKAIVLSRVAQPGLETSDIPEDPSPTLTIELAESEQAAIASTDFNWKVLESPDGMLASRLGHMFLNAYLSGATWPFEILQKAQIRSLEGWKAWQHVAESALVEAWLTLGDDAILGLPEQYNLRAMRACAHLARHPASQSTIRFIWLAVHTVPEFDNPRGHVETFYGWIPVEALATVPLAEGHTWYDVIGQHRVRWSVIVSKSSYSQSGGLTAGRGPNALHDFAFFFYDGALADEERERMRSRIAAGRGLRAAIVPIETGISQPAAWALLSAATLTCLRRNVDVYLSRSVSGQAFFGRDTEIDGISSALTQGAGVAITGARKVGKSSLAAQYASLSGPHPTGILDMSSLVGEFTDEKLATAISKRTFTGSSNSFADLLRRLERPSGSVPFLVIDEFGIPFEFARRNLEGAKGALALAMFLRTALDAGLLRVIVCSPRRSLYERPYLETALGTFDNPLFGRFSVISLRGLDAAATERLLLFYARRGLVTLKAPACESAAAVCGGFPLVARAVLHKATNDCDRPLALDENDFDAAAMPAGGADSPWQIVRSALWQWAIGWAPEHLRLLLAGTPLPADDLTAELRAAGLVGETGSWAFPLLAAVAARHADDIGANLAV